MNPAFVYANLYSLLCRAFKKRAPSAIKAIKQFATKAMGTTDVRIDPTMNVAIWSRGIRNVPHRLRIQLSRRRNEAEDAAEKLYTLVTPITVSSFKGTYLVNPI